MKITKMEQETRLAEKNARLWAKRTDEAKENLRLGLVANREDQCMAAVLETGEIAVKIWSNEGSRLYVVTPSYYGTDGKPRKAQPYEHLGIKQ